MSVGGFVATGDLGVVAALSLGLLHGSVVLDRERDLAVAVRGQGHNGGSEEESSGEELHFDGWEWVFFCEVTRKSE